MSIYDDLQTVASELLNEFRQGSVNLIKITPNSSGTPDNPGDPTETSYPLDATVKGVSFNYVKQSLALETDLMVVAAVQSGLIPDEKDFIEIDGTRHKIVRNVSVPAAGTEVAWKFIVRKGG